MLVRHIFFGHNVDLTNGNHCMFGREIVCLTENWLRSEPNLIVGPLCCGSNSGKKEGRKAEILIDSSPRSGTMWFVAFVM